MPLALHMTDMYNKSQFTRQNLLVKIYICGMCFLDICAKTLSCILQPIRDYNTRSTLSNITHVSEETAGKMLILSAFFIFNNSM